MIQTFELVAYRDESGFEPYTHWFNNLDQTLRAIVGKRLDRVTFGNFGDCKAVGDQIFELRIHVGSGYRIYFTQEGKRLILLLCGGNKSTQKKDVSKAKKLQSKIKSKIQGT